MRIGEIAKRAGVTTKAVRYYESMGLIRSRRRANGYRDYDERQARLVAEIRALSRLGITLKAAKPFVDCLVGGHDNADDCPELLAAYRNAIDELTGRITELDERRAALIELLDTASERPMPRCEFTHEDDHHTIKEAINVH